MNPVTTVALIYIGGLIAAYVIMVFFTNKGHYTIGWALLCLFGFPAVCVLVSIGFSSWPSTASTFGVSLVTSEWLGAYLVPPIVGVLISLAFAGGSPKGMVVTTICVACLGAIATAYGTSAHRLLYVPEASGSVALWLCWWFADSSAVEVEASEINSKPSTKRHESEIETGISDGTGNNNSINSEIENRVKYLEREIADLKRQIK